ncbi:MAG: 2,3-bisphosphoglycerate-independent phosphoglycerate mutase [Proteobacteria bacterium]|nr:2,3-bisphosphoglycerate-independent phosphoglycerate mutase [Pseudomonadota bacterium]
MPRPLMLLILDGWGYREPAVDNAISNARTPNWDRLWKSGSHTLLDTSGLAVGLPQGQMGNSEVGHMNIGAGRIVYQDFTRIDKAIADGDFDSNPALCAAIDKSMGQTVHIMGLLSPGGVHSHEEQMFATIRLAQQRGAKAIVVHAFLDGRDTPPRSALASIKKLEALLAEIPSARIGSLCGRYYAMDRDQRWDRIQRAWDMLVNAEAPFHYDNAEDALAAAYARDESDEFVQPSLIGKNTAVISGDSIIFINFRSDRAREISQAFVDPGFTGFTRQPPKLTSFVSMTEYLDGLPTEIAFPSLKLEKVFGELLEARGLRQLRAAETEKYAHVTFFFNGGREAPFRGEDRKLIPSPQVATYDLRPQMNAPLLQKALVEAIESAQYDVIISNVANPDMVGHSGKLDAAIKAVEAVDVLLGGVSAAMQAAGGALLITADHGNVEQMTDPLTGQAHTAHTTNPVPFLYPGHRQEMRSGGSLRDIAPTMLRLLGLSIPTEMSGHDLLDLND